MKVKKLTLPKVLSLAALEKLSTEIDDARDHQLPILLIAGREGFVAGAHLGELSKLDGTKAAGYAHSGRALVHSIINHPRPTAAAVEGPCFGGAVDIVFAADVVVAAPHLTFSHPGIHRGLITAWTGTWSVAASLSPPHIAQLFLGNGMDAWEAQEAGLVLKIAPNPEEQAHATLEKLSVLNFLRIVLWRRLRSNPASRPKAETLARLISPPETKEPSFFRAGQG